MRNVIPMRTAKTGYILISVLLCVLGLMLTVNPAQSVAAVGTFAGWTMIGFGVFKLIGYFSRDLYRLAFQFDLAFGILMLILGAVILTRPENLLHFLCIAVGLTFAADGLLRMQTARDAKEFGIPAWWLIFGSALLTAALGIVMLLRPSQSAELLMRLFGIGLLAEGILNLITVLMTVRIIRSQRPDIIETTAEIKGE